MDSIQIFLAEYKTIILLATAGVVVLSLLAKVVKLGISMAVAGAIFYFVTSILPQL